MKKTYMQPQSEESWLEPESLICLSGSSTDLTIDPAVDPWTL